MKTIILLSVLLSACTNNTRIALLAGVAGMAITCDVHQTYMASNGGRWDGPWREGNPLLGSTPAPSTLVFAGVASTVALTTVAVSKLPTWVKYAVLGSVLAAETVVIVSPAPRLGYCGEAALR